MTALLIIFYRIQLALEPYKTRINNRLERLELIAGTFTLYGGILFVDDSKSVPTLNFIVFISILIINTRFLLNWIYAMLMTFGKEQKFINVIALLFAYILWIKGKGGYGLNKSPSSSIPKCVPKMKSRRRDILKQKVNELNEKHNNSKSMSKYNDESVFVDEQIPDSNIALNEENPSYFNIEIKDIKGNFQHDKFKQKTEQDSINKHIKKLNNNSLDLSNLTKIKKIGNNDSNMRILSEDSDILRLKKINKN